MTPDEESSLALLGKAIEQLPRYVIEQFAVPIMTAIVSEPLTGGVALGSALLGVVTNAWIGGATFMLLYTTLRTINAIANAIGVSGQRMAAVLQSPPPNPPQYPSPQFTEHLPMLPTTPQHMEPVAETGPVT